MEDQNIVEPDDKATTIQVFGGEHSGYYIDEITGWNSMYRLCHIDGRKTDRALYERPLMLGELVAVSPYYTEHAEYVLLSPADAMAYIAAGEDK